MTTQKDSNLETLVECQPQVGSNPTDIQYPPKQCEDQGLPNLRRVDTQPPKDWTKPKTFNKLGLGQSGNCDPIQYGRITNDLIRQTEMLFLDILEVFVRLMKRCWICLGILWLLTSRVKLT